MFWLFSSSVTLRFVGIDWGLATCGGLVNELVLLFGLLNMLINQEFASYNVVFKNLYILAPMNDIDGPEANQN